VRVLLLYSMRHDGSEIVVDLIGCHSSNIFPLAGDQARHSMDAFGDLIARRRETVHSKIESVCHGPDIVSHEQGKCATHIHRNIDFTASGCGQAYHLVILQVSVW
jgi:hypothetical protein